MDHLFPSDLSVPTDDTLMRSLLPILLPVTILAACAVPPPAPTPRPPAKVVVAAPTGLTAADALDVLARVASLSADQQRTERARLDDARTLAPAGQFQLALLLGREEDPAALERGIKLLGAIDAEGPRVQALIDLAKNLLKAQLDAARQNARAQDLQTRIDQIKALEKSLQQRDAAPKPR